MFLLFMLFAQGHITNPLVAEHAMGYSLVKDLTLGGEDAGDLEVFGANTFVCARPDGSFYVLDGSNFRITAYDAKGKAKTTFGRKGPGPGEFSEPVAITLDHKGQVVVFDTGTHKIVRFDAGGSFLEERRFSNGIHGVFQPVGLVDGSFSFTCYKIGQEMQMGYEQVVLDGEMNQTATLYTAPAAKLDWQQAGSPSFWVDFLHDQLEIVGRGWPMQAVVGKRLLTMRTHDYRGSFYVDGKENASFEKAFKPIPASDEMKEALCEPMWQSLAANPALSDNMGQSIFDKALGKLESMTRVPPVFGLAPVDGGFAVLAAYNPLKREGTIDFFSANGNLLGHTAYEGTYQFLTGAGNYLYAVGPDADDNLVVERYRVEKGNTSGH